MIENLVFFLYCDIKTHHEAHKTTEYSILVINLQGRGGEACCVVQFLTLDYEWLEWLEIKT